MRIHPRLSLALVVLLLGAPAALRALEKEEKKWLESVKPIMLPDEEKTFKGLKEKADRQEFQKIFWARRDPDLETPENEFKAEYDKAVNETNAQYRVPGSEGYETDCGRVYILLGKPDQVKKDNAATVSPGARSPETWTYRDRPGQTFQGGQAQISFDAECRAPAAVGEQLNRVAEGRIAHLNIDYRFGKDGRLVKLVDLLPKPSPAQALLKAPRQDFPVAAQTEFLKVQDGGTALLGLVRGETAGLGLEESGGRKTLKIVVCAQALNEEGRAAAFAEEKKTVPVAADGSFVASFRMGLKPGKYTLRAGALDEKTGKGSLATMPVDVPSFSKDELSVASLVILQDVQDLAEGAPDPQDPFAAFFLGRSRLIPHFGQVFSKSDALSFFYQVYDLKVDETTGKASGAATLSILKAGKPVARAPEQAFETPVGGNVVGPVPLDKYEPGKYVVQLKVTDKLAKKEKVEEVPFEIKP